MASWRDLIGKQMALHGESLADAVFLEFGARMEWDNDGAYVSVPAGDVDAELDRDFDDGFGGCEGTPFTLWSDERVYFPACYDGAEWCASVPRNPKPTATDHIGGG